MSTETQASLKALFTGIKSLLNTVRKQNPDYNPNVAEIVSLCDSALEKQSYAELSYKLRDLTVDVDQNFDEHRVMVQKHFQGLVMNLRRQNLSSYTPTQKKLIEEISRLSEDKRTDPTEVMRALSELSHDMATSMVAYRNESYGEKTIKNTEYAEGVDSVMAADVATAGKRIARDLQNLAKQLKATGSTEPEVIKILNEIEGACQGKVKFYESLDLLSRVTWLLYRLNDKSAHREKEYLVNLSSQLSAISKNCAESLRLSDEAEAELSDFDKDFMNEINKITNSSKSAASLEELKVAVAQHMEKMQEKLSEHMLKQALKMKEQKKSIQEQQSTISKLESKVDSLQGELHDVSVESGLDQLTSLPNRKSYDEYIKSQYTEFRKKKNGLSLMLLDIDHFKKINDTYGHAAGDAVLKDFSKVIAHIVEKVDGLFAARYGGEEFALIGTNINKRKFVQIGRKIKEIIASRKFKISKDKNISVTISLGTAFFNSENDLIDSVFRSADKALYAAKKAGRNQLWICNKTLLVKCEEKEIGAQ